MKQKDNKGLDMIGIIDCHVPAVIEEMKLMIETNEAEVLQEGGIRFQDLTILLGSEVEIYDETCHGPIHVLCFFPSLVEMKHFSSWLSERMKNINLSSQRFYGTGKELQSYVHKLGGLFIPAHIFTPFKSLYGKGVKQSLTEVFDPKLIDAVELGLSADTNMASEISELDAYPFLSNSDAHSQKRIAREYQSLMMKNANFLEFKKLLHNKGGRYIEHNFGLHPKLGKYSHSFCRECKKHTSMTESGLCSLCGSKKVVKGVVKRALELAQVNQRKSAAVERPDYMYQVPLDFLPSLGPKTYEKLLNAFHTEMNIIHRVPLKELQGIVRTDLAERIIEMREGNVKVIEGGGGIYGKVE